MSRLATKPTAGVLRIVFFHSLTCNECRKVKRMLDRILKPWGGRARVEWKSTGDIQVFRELLLYDEHYGYGVRTKSPPVMFVGRRHLEGEKRIYRDLARVVREELAAGAVTYRPPAGPATKGGGDVPDEIVGRFRGFRIAALAAAGLLDGVNPCAFTTIVFLLSMLTYLGKTRRQLAVVGVGFTAAVFVTYFLLGLGLLGAIKTFSVSRGISTGLAIAVGVLAFVLAAWSLVDFVRYRRTKDTKKVTLGLPKSVKARIHKVIRAGLRTRSLLIGSITVGFLVSVLESLCTGQVYLPTILFVTRSPDLRTRALGFLLLYNVMFILPLVAVLALAYYGVKPERLGGLLRRHLGAAKLAMAGVGELSAGVCRGGSSRGDAPARGDGPPAGRPVVCGATRNVAGTNGPAAQAEPKAQGQARSQTGLSMAPPQLPGVAAVENPI